MLGLGLCSDHRHHLFYSFSPSVPFRRLSKYPRRNIINTGNFLFISASAVRHYSDGIKALFRLYSGSIQALFRLIGSAVSRDRAEEVLVGARVPRYLRGHMYSSMRTHVAV